MKYNKFTIQINKPVSEVFEFTLNPKNTPKWIDSIIYEERNQSPTKIGTIYKNKNRNGNWSKYKVTKLKVNEMFVFTKNDNNYHVRYTFKPLNNNAMELEYHEWLDRGEIFEEPFVLEALQKLKSVLENS